MRKHKISANLIVAVILVFCMFSLAACGAQKPEENEAQDGSTGAVNQAISELTPASSGDENNGTRTMTINRSDAAPYTPAPAPEPVGSVSVAEAPELDIAAEDIPGPELTEEPEEELEPGTFSGNGTPLVFDVGDCTCIAFGEFDNGMSDSIIDCINEYRADGGLKPVEKNLSLRFCADCRSKELTYNFDHLRVNALSWYTVAPKYYKAELIATDYDTAKETVDAWMQTATGRQYLLSKELLSIGVSTFRSDGRSYFVCALGN